MEFPKRKTRKHGLGACRFTGTIQVFDGSIQLPRIGVVCLKEHDDLPTDKRITQATIVRRDAHNKAACAITDKRPSVFVIEERNVKGMFKNRRPARALSDAALGQFGRILTYMAEDAGVTGVKAGPFFASSKTGACCGWKNERLTLGSSIVRL